MQSRRTIALFLLSLPLIAQNEPYIGDWRAPAGDPVSSPRVPCAALRSLTGYEFTIITAVSVAASADAPAFCRAIGQVLPEIRFELNLPASWNRRLYMFGNGGYAGEDLESSGRARHRNRALQMGFAVTSTNTGHDARQEPLGTFAVNSQKLFDYAFRSLHITAETAKKLAAIYYGAAPTRSYFYGCSTGGRQGLILAQRFPQDFDGIVVGMPVLDFTGTMVRYAASIRALEAAPIAPVKLKPLADRVYAHCDPKDGLQDGLIDDPRRCDFKPSEHVPKCAGAEGPDCFTEAQIQALTVIYSDVMSQGKRVFPGQPVGAEIAGPNGRPGWDRWLVQDAGKTIGLSFAETFFRYMAFPEKNPDYQVSQFDLEKDPARLGWISQVLDATDPELAPFRDRGGKILMYFGWADPALNPRMGVEYYESVLRHMGPGARDFFRLYMMPGVFHCGGGVGPAAFDPLDHVIRWVEQGAAPESIHASLLQEGKVLRTRPLCPYPHVAKYKGSGSVDDAANFTCASPE